MVQMQRFKVTVELKSGEQKKGWVEIEAPVVRIPGFRTPISHKQLRSLKLRAAKTYGEVKSIKVTDMEVA